MKIAAMVWGLLAIAGMFVAAFPCLGSLNWLNIPFAAIGLIFSVIVLVQTTDNKKGMPITGVVCCAIAAVFGLVRLIMGGGLL